MSKSTTQLNVERMIAGGASTSEVEDFIERQSIDDDEKAALALLTWACHGLNIDPQSIGPVVIVDAEAAEKLARSSHHRRRSTRRHVNRVGRLVLDTDLS